MGVNFRKGGLANLTDSKTFLCSAQFQQWGFSRFSSRSFGAGDSCTMSFEREMCQKKARIGRLANVNVINASKALCAHFATLALTHSFRSNITGRGRAPVILSRLGIIQD